MHIRKKLSEFCNKLISSKINTIYSSHIDSFIKEHMGLQQWQVVVVWRRRLPRALDSLATRRFRGWRKSFLDQSALMEIFLRLIAEETDARLLIISIFRISFCAVGKLGIVRYYFESVLISWILVSYTRTAFP